MGSRSSKYNAEDLYIVRGQLNFGSNGPPIDIPDGSTLTIKLVDASRRDKVVELGRMVKHIWGYKYGDVILYEVKSDKRPPYLEASVNAVLSVGWVPRKKDGMHRNDWGTDIHHSVQLSSNKKEYNKNLVINRCN